MSIRLDQFTAWKALLYLHKLQKHNNNPTQIATVNKKKSLWLLPSGIQKQWEFNSTARQHIYGVHIQTLRNEYVYSKSIKFAKSKKKLNMTALNLPYKFSQSP